MFFLLYSLFIYRLQPHDDTRLPSNQDARHVRSLNRAIGSRGHNAAAGCLRYTPTIAYICATPNTDFQGKRTLIDAIEFYAHHDFFGAFDHGMGQVASR